LPSLFLSPLFSLFSFITPPPPPLYPLSLHDALPISKTLRISGDILEQHCRWIGTLVHRLGERAHFKIPVSAGNSQKLARALDARSEEHTSELQSRGHLVCRLLLEKKKNKIII